MSYDPTKPVEGTLCDAAEMRSQLEGLHDEIAAVPAGPPGPQGPPGPPGEVTQAQLSNDLSNTQNATMLATLPLTSANTNAVPLLSISSGDFAIQTLIDKVNELILAARR